MQILSLWDSFWPFLTSFGPVWPYLGIFEPFRSSERYEICEKQIETWTLWLKWGVYRISTTKGFWDVDFVSIGLLLALFDLFWSLLTLFGHIWALSVIWEVWNMWKTNRNMNFVIEMRGLPCFYDERFGRCRFCLYWTTFGPFWPLLVPFDHFWSLLNPFGIFCPYLGIFEHFRSSERYEIHGLLLEKLCFWLKWGVN